MAWDIMNQRNPKHMGATSPENHYWKNANDKLQIKRRAKAQEERTASMKYDSRTCEHDATACRHKRYCALSKLDACSNYLKKIQAIETAASCYFCKRYETAQCVFRCFRKPSAIDEIMKK